MALDENIVDIIIAAARKNNVPPDLALSIAFVESSFNPEAEGPETKSGRAVGLFQIIPSTGRALKLKNAKDPAENADAGTRYIRENLDRFGGDPIKATAAHNTGPTAVAKYNGTPPFEETRKYLQKINAVIPEFQNLLKERGTDTAAPESSASAPKPEEVEKAVAYSFQRLADPKSQRALEKAAELGNPYARAWVASVARPEEEKSHRAVAKIIDRYLVPGVPSSGKPGAAPKSVSGPSLLEHAVSALNTSLEMPGRFLRGLGLETLKAGFKPTSGEPLMKALASARGGKETVDGETVVKEVFGEAVSKVDRELGEVVAKGLHTGGDFLEKLGVPQPLANLIADPTGARFLADYGEQHGFLGALIHAVSDPTNLLLLSTPKPRPPGSGSVIGKYMAGASGLPKEQVEVILKKPDLVRAAIRGIDTEKAGAMVPGTVTTETVALKSRLGLDRFMKMAGKELAEARKVVGVDPIVSTKSTVGLFKSKLKELQVSIRVGTPVGGKPARMRLVPSVNSPVSKTAAFRSLETHLRDLLQNPNQKWSDLLLKRQAIDDVLKVQADRAVRPPTDQATRLLSSLRKGISDDIRNSPSVPQVVKDADMAYAQKARFGRLLSKFLGTESQTEKRLAGVVGPNNRFNQKLLQKLSKDLRVDVLDELTAIGAAQSSKKIFPLAGPGGGGVGGQVARAGLAVGALMRAYGKFTSGDIPGALANASVVALMSPAISVRIGLRWGKLSSGGQKILSGAIRSEKAFQLWLTNEDFRDTTFEVAEEMGGKKR